MSTSVLGVGKR